MIDLNPSLPIELRAEAVGAEECDAEFCVMPDTSMGKLGTSGFQATKRSQKTMVVPVVTLDGLWRSGAIDVPSVIKIDVEGAEMLVLRGARALLSTESPTLFLEVHSGALAAQCRSFLAECGYGLESFQSGAGTNGEISHCMARRQSQSALRLGA
jgi:FkbM family methyltransferase